MYLGGKTGLWSGPESSMGWLGSNCDSEAKRDPESRGIVEVFVAGDFVPVLECDMAGLLLGFDEAMFGFALGLDEAGYVGNAESRLFC